MSSPFRFMSTMLLFAALTACGSDKQENQSDSSTPANQPSTTSLPPPDPSPVDPTPDPDPTPTPNPDPTDPIPEPPIHKSVTLSWNTPTARTDGDPLSPTEIGGYEVYFFREGSAENNTINIADPNTTHATATGLVAGIYHFAIVSYDTAGLYSEVSDYISATIQ